MNDPKSARCRDPYLLLALLIALIAALPLLIGPGIVNTRAGGDAPFLLQRVQGIAQNLRTGNLPARWMADGAHGLGYPAYVFYAALPYYIAALLSELGLGVLWGLKLTQTLAFALAGVATYGLARELGARRTGALLASAVYSTAPFHLVNVYVRGDSLSEFFAMALFPTLLWLLRRLASRPTAGRCAALAAAYAALVLSHNISALLFSPLLGIWLLGEVFVRPREGRWRRLLWGGSALGLGLLLSAWFWMPALRETSLVQLGDQTSGYFHFAGHFRGLDLLQPRLIHSYRIDGDHDPFSMGCVQTVIMGLGLIAVIWGALRRRRLAWEDALLALTLLGATWLITPTSRWIWEHVPLLDYTQFPWRWLSIQALAGALLVPRIETLWREHRADHLIALGGSALVLLAGLAGLHIDRLPLQTGDITPERLMLYETYSGNIGSTVRHEYLPSEMIPRPHTSGVQLEGGAKPTPLALEGTLVSAAQGEQTPESEHWRITVSERALLAFHTTFYPGWEATVDGVPQGVEPLPGLGLIGLRLEPGEHDVRLHYEGTRTQCVARLLSLLALVGWLGLLVWTGVARPASRTWLIAGSLAVILLFAVPRLTPRAAPAPSEGQGVWLMDWVRAPYWHLEPEGVRFDDLALLAGGIEAVNVEPGETQELQLRWRAADPEAIVTLELLPATAHLYRPAPVWVRVSQPLDATELSLPVALPDDLPPGLYVLRLSVDRAGEELDPETAQGVAMDRLIVGVLQCVGERVASGSEPMIAQYGPPESSPVLALLSAEADIQEDRVEVALDWRSERQAPLNYYLSLRLLDAEGAVIASRDLPPLLGGYPTSLWQPGELLRDRIRLDIEPEAAKELAALEIVLYDRLSMAGAGTARVPLP